MTSGVWVTYWLDMGIHIEAIYDDELTAYRQAEEYHSVGFIPYGEPVRNMGDYEDT